MYDMHHTFYNELRVESIRRTFFACGICGTGRLNVGNMMRGGHRQASWCGKIIGINAQLAHTE